MGERVLVYLRDRVWDVDDIYLVGRLLILVLLDNLRPVRKCVSHEDSDGWLLLRLLFSRLSRLFRLLFRLLAEGSVFLLQLRAF